VVAALRGEAPTLIASRVTVATVGCVHQFAAGWADWAAGLHESPGVGRLDQTATIRGLHESASVGGLAMGHRRRRCGACVGRCGAADRDTADDGSSTNSACDAPDEGTR